MMKRNAVIAVGNLVRTSQNPELLARIRDISQDRDEPGLVRAAAAEVLRQLGTI
jgi:hypothetical protein